MIRILAATTVSYPRDIPPLWFLAAVAVMLGLHWTWPGPRLMAMPVTLWFVGLLAAGLLLLLWSAGLFRRLGTGIRPFSAATVLVARGPFRCSRNPMYLGMLAMLCGGAGALGSTSPWLVPPLLWWVLDARFVRAEERFLRDRFGASYEEFCQRVRRWL